ASPTVFAGVMTALVEQDRVVRVADRVTYHAERVAAAREAVRQAIAQHGSVSVAELRDQLGVSRKYTLALLEYLDATGFTRREGDARVLA
ncbi:MAG: SelB C-terminal domain-containing protein, partial [Armatimonadia bacterium]